MRILTTVIMPCMRIFFAVFFTVFFTVFFAVFFAGFFSGFFTHGDSQIFGVGLSA